MYVALCEKSLDTPGLMSQTYIMKRSEVLVNSSVNGHNACVHLHTYIYDIAEQTLYASCGN